MSIRNLPVLITLFTLLSFKPATAATFFADRTSFETATQALVLEDFRDSSFASGLTISSDNGERRGNQWRDTVSRPLLGLLGGAQSTFNFAAPQIAFGATFDLSAGGLDAGLRFVLDGSIALGTELAQADETFFGFIADTPFSSVTIMGGTNGGLLTTSERYTMDDLIFTNTVAPSTVPLPAPFLLLLAGMVALYTLRRRRTVSLTT
ncbi:hypothetical protein [Yoonia sp. 208BN28-4]|uniref:hypothetical protein n=1 Tax=Yoonia sp. 208BN28-4 TaxID=3126505 RepID=UPI0030A137A7